MKRGGEEAAFWAPWPWAMAYGTMDCGGPGMGRGPGRKEARENKWMELSRTQVMYPRRHAAVGRNLRLTTLSPGAPSS